MRLFLLLSSFILAASVWASDQTLLETAKGLFEKHRYAEAKAILEKTVGSEPNDAESNYWLGLTTLSMNDYVSAITYLEKATTIDSKQPRYFHQLGDAYGIAAQKASLLSKMSFAEKCIASYDQAVALDPENVEYRKSRYEFYRSAPSMVGGGMDKATAEMLEIEKRDPVQGGGLRADIKQKEGKTDEAFAILAALQQKYPDSKVARYQFGRLTAMTDEKLDEGAAALKDYLTYTPKDSEPPLWAAHWRLAMILEKKGSITEARSHYEETLKLNPSFDRAREALKRLNQ